jgi:RNA polymerase sigma-70 factor (ECF subfamily)
MDEPVEQFARLYDEHIWAVYGFFGYRLESREDAEDLTQRTFEKALKAWGRFDDSRGSPATWLLAIARNLLIDHHRSDRSDRLEPLEDEDLHPDPASAGAEIGVEPEIELALARLTDRERELIALRFGADLSGKEIAAIMELSLANVQQILSRSLRKLRGELEGGAARESGSPVRGPGQTYPRSP